jgi:hypothetical protein
MDWLWIHSHLDELKAVGAAAIQLFLGISASILAWKIGTDKNNRDRDALKIQLFERRYKVYLAFKDFIYECAWSDYPTTKGFNEFEKGTEEIDFMFGPEIINYRREVSANALAIKGIITEAPCTSPPSVGSIVGYFPGSTSLTDYGELRDWFTLQKTERLEMFFRPYLDYSAAGVHTELICMKSSKLPDPPTVFRRIKSKAKKKP